MSAEAGRNAMTFEQAVEIIAVRDARYAADAYYFLRDALEYTVKELKKPLEGAGRHVTGQELCAGIRDYALREFGPLALTVLRAWGLARTEDFGDMVYNLIETGVFGKTERDERQDFANGYDFYQTFGAPFEAAPPASGGKRSRRRAG
jgi:uncharacterized repeat protein (TIGR04138 family)